MKIRKADRADIDGIVAIEEVCFSVPWSRESLITDITENPRAQYFVAETDGNIAGYAGMWEVADEGHINNVAVMPRYRRHGVASILLATMLYTTDRHGLVGHTLEVRAGNEAAIKLYEKFGFKSAGIRPGYYKDDGEDAVIMWRTGNHDLIGRVLDEKRKIYHFGNRNKL